MFLRRDLPDIPFAPKTNLEITVRLLETSKPLPPVTAYQRLSCFAPFFIAHIALRSINSSASSPPTISRLRTEEYVVARWEYWPCPPANPPVSF